MTMAETHALPPEDIFGNTKKIRYFLARLGRHRQALGRPLTLLDFGCGNGTALGAYLGGWQDRYYGVDIHQPSLEHARRAFGDERTSFVDHVPDDVTFDALLYGDVIEHLDDPLVMLRDHVTQLAPDGIVLGSVPNGYGPCEIEKYVDRSLGLYDKVQATWRWLNGRSGRANPDTVALPYNHDSGHVQFFTMRSLKKLVAEAGLEIRDFGHGGFVGADLSGSTILRPQRLVDLNVRVADHLPSWLVSTWYFELSRPRDAG